MTEHPGIPVVGVLAAAEGAVPGLPAEVVMAVVSEVCPVLWREWTRDMAVVRLPWADGVVDDGVHQWHTGYGHPVEAHVDDEVPTVEDGMYTTGPEEARHRAACLLAAADRAEQLAAEQAEAVTDA